MNSTEPSTIPDEPSTIPDIEWLWESHPKYLPFHPNDSLRLEAALKSGQQFVRFRTSNGSLFQVDLQNMVQTNRETGECRCVVRTSREARRKQGAKLFDVIVSGEIEQKRLAQHVVPLDGDMLAGVRDLHEQRCALCLEGFDCNAETADEKRISRLSKCDNHYFHSHCIRKSLQFGSKCPCCGIVYDGVMVGPMPNGRMLAVTLPVGAFPIAGFADVGTIVIAYDIPSGTQRKGDPFPGTPFLGCTRRYYLPDTAEGRRAVMQLRRCFEMRQTFALTRIVTSIGVVLNGVDHKLRPSGGPGIHGFPDTSYFERLNVNLVSKGIV
jgi:hypothetical protein